MGHNITVTYVNNGSKLFELLFFFFTFVLKLFCAEAFSVNFNNEECEGFSICTCVYKSTLKLFLYQWYVYMQFIFFLLLLINSRSTSTFLKTSSGGFSSP